MRSSQSGDTFRLGTVGKVSPLIFRGGDGATGGGGAQPLQGVDTISGLGVAGWALLQPPVADLSLSGPTSGPAPLAVTLDATLSYDPDGTIVLWEWDVDGDSIYEFTLGTPAILIYTYQVQGDYTLRLRVSDDDGIIDTDEVLIQVE